MATVISSPPVTFTARAVCPVCQACPTDAGKPAESKPAPENASYQTVGWEALPNWPGDALASSWAAWKQSCTRLINRADWKPLCTDAQTIAADDTAAMRTFFETRFQAWQVRNGEDSDTGLVTGYYEPLLTGGSAYRPGRVPLHAVPDDLLTIDLGALYPDLKGQRVRGRVDGKKVVPYWNRADIDSGRAPLQENVLAWADDAIEAFFLQVQGSGRVQLDDGRLLRIGYADQNGHPYRSIGKWLADQGELSIDQVTMQAIQAWARANPARLPELLAANPSYVFFRVLPGGEGGPIGAFNVPLTDGASIAVDPKFIPLGAPVFLDTTRPNDSTPLQRLMVAQDTGGAIRGPVRADFFWGFGHDAGALAGKMKQRGRLWVLWPKDLPLPNGK
ncbi:MAG: MltA domain-containing protein [Moraxellaceae bacterium]|nr:MltA domain-containing protein [Moraxellaceae bacterium]